LYNTKKFYDEKKVFIICCICVLAFWAGGQQCATFDDIALQPDSWYNGSDGEGGFSSGGFWFPNSYDSEWDSWMGFSVSNMKDSTTAGYMNQYSAITAGGADSSENYAVAYVAGELELDLHDTTVISGFYITNSTFAYLTLRDGDDFSKKFGGVSGDDPDYFKLIITGIDAEGNETEEKEFFLADYTFEDSHKDYIVNRWEWVDLKVLGEITRLKFAMESTDMASWGMNTPSYFCIDNFNDDMPLFSEKRYDNVELKLFPNPFRDNFSLEVPAGAEEIIVAGSDGKEIVNKKIQGERYIRVSTLSGMPAGTYFVRIKTGETILTGKLIKM